MMTTLPIVAVSVVALLALLGAWRGGRREVVALLGTLLAANLMQLWSDRWKVTLDGWFGSSNSQTIPLVIYVGVFLLIVAIVGYGGSLLLDKPKARPTPRERSAGALLGLLNGVLVVAYALRFAVVADEGLTAQIATTPWMGIVYNGLPYLLLATPFVVGGLLIVRFIMVLARATPQPGRPPQQQQGPGTGGPKPAGPPPQGTPPNR